MTILNNKVNVLCITQKYEHQQIRKMQKIIAHRKCVPGKQHLVNKNNKKYMFRKALYNNLNFDGLVKMHTWLLNIPTLDRHKSFVTGI